MNVNELIAKLKRFNPDGNMEVCTHYYESEQGYNEVIDYISMEEDADGKLVIVIHSADGDFE